MVGLQLPSLSIGVIMRYGWWSVNRSKISSIFVLAGLEWVLCGRDIILLNFVDTKIP